MLWWVAVLGCAKSSRVDALEQELAATKAELAEMETRLAALEAAAPDEREARREEIRARLQQRREERKLAGEGEPTTPLDLAVRPDLTPRQAASDSEYFTTLGRALLHKGQDGEYDGYRLSAIRGGSLGARAGLRNGDILRQVNGAPVTSIEEAMIAYATMRDPKVTVLTLDLTRGGEPVELRVPLDEVPPPYEPAADVPAEPVP